MEKLVILSVLLMSLALFGCSQEEAAAPTQGSAPAAVPAEKSPAVPPAEKVAAQTKETADQLMKEGQEQVAQVGQQAAAVVQQGKDALADGQAVYTKACISCHKLGIAGAPKTGDKAAWKSLVASGVDQMTTNAINGKGKMPAKGGNSSLSDAEVRAAVEYMAEQAK